MNEQPIVGTIRASSLWTNRTLLIIVCLGFLSLAIFISGTIPNLQSETETLVNLVQIIGAAGLGATFICLYTAREYLHSKTFNPKYNQDYIIRFAMGMLAGIILGNMATVIPVDTVNASVGSAADNNSNGLAGVNAITLAFVGGFSAEAVAQILLRIAETLVTVVRGSGSQYAKVEAEKDFTKRKERSPLCCKMLPMRAWTNNKLHYRTLSSNYLNSGWSS